MVSKFESFVCCNARAVEFYFGRGVPAKLLLDMDFTCS